MRMKCSSVFSVRLIPGGKFCKGSHVTIFFTSFSNFMYVCLFIFTTSKFIYFYFICFVCYVGRSVWGFPWFDRVRCFLYCYSAFRVPDGIPVLHFDCLCISLPIPVFFLFCFFIPTPQLRLFLFFYLCVTLAVPLPLLSISAIFVCCPCRPFPALCCLRPPCRRRLRPWVSPACQCCYFCVAAAANIGKVTRQSNFR